jgi:hypothetical protein
VFKNSCFCAKKQKGSRPVNPNGYCCISPKFFIYLTLQYTTFIPNTWRHGFAASLTRSLTHSYATAAACAGLASAYRGPTTKQVVQCSPQVPTTNSRDPCLETMTRGQIVHSPHPHTYFFFEIKIHWTSCPVKSLDTVTATLVSSVRGGPMVRSRSITLTHGPHGYAYLCSCEGWFYIFRLPSVDRVKLIKDT